MPRIRVLIAIAFTLAAGAGAAGASRAAGSHPADVARSHVEEVTAGRHPYTVVQAGTMDGRNCRLPMGCGINREGAFVQTWESNRSVRMENVGATDVVGPWPEVKKLEQYCRRRKLPFSLIYWASGYPALAKRGLADDSTWYVSVMQQGYDYAMVQGSPDHYVVQSWLDAPSHSTPETAPFTFTRSVLDFARRFARRSQP